MTTQAYNGQMTRAHECITTTNCGKPSTRCAHLQTVIQNSQSSASTRLDESILKKWTCGNSQIDLVIDKVKGLVAKIINCGEMIYVEKEWIEGIPKEIQKNPEQLRLFLADTYVRLNRFDDGGFAVRVGQRLRGGVPDPRRRLVLNADLIFELLQGAVSESQKFKDKDLVIFLGITGSGKSTTIASLLGGGIVEKRKVVLKDGETITCTKDEARQYLQEGKTELAKISKVMVLDGNKEDVLANLNRSDSNITSIPDIGIKDGSCTRFAAGYTSGGTRYVDSGGFLDNRGPEIDAVNAISIYLAVKNARRIKFVICSPYKDMVGRATSFHEVSKQIFKRLIPFEDSSNFTKAFGPSLLFLSTFAVRDDPIEGGKQALKSSDISSHLKEMAASAEKDVQEAKSKGQVETVSDRHATSLICNFLSDHATVHAIHPENPANVRELKDAIESMKWLDNSRGDISFLTPYSPETYSNVRECLVDTTVESANALNHCATRIASLKNKADELKIKEGEITSVKKKISDLEDLIKQGKDKTEIDKILAELKEELASKQQIFKQLKTEGQTSTGQIKQLQAQKEELGKNESEICEKVDNVYIPKAQSTFTERKNEINLPGLGEFGKIQNKWQEEEKHKAKHDFVYSDPHKPLLRVEQHHSSPGNFEPFPTIVPGETTNLTITFRTAEGLHGQASVKYFIKMKDSTKTARKNAEIDGKIRDIETQLTQEKKGQEQRLEKEIKDLEDFLADARVNLDKIEIYKEGIAAQERSIQALKDEIAALKIELQGLVGNIESTIVPQHESLNHFIESTMDEELRKDSFVKRFFESFTTYTDNKRIFDGMQT